MTDPPADDPIGEIEALVASIEELPDEALKARSRALVSGVLALHRRGLVRMLEVVRKRSTGMADVMKELADDPAVSSLLVLHDLHPADLETRAVEAVERLRGAYPDLSFDRLDAGRLRVVIGARGGNPASTARAVEASILEAVPDLVAVNVAVAADPPLVTLRRKGASL
ncbi:MAG: hypothetical protein HOW73_27510 [Polyangiaceae bacterium]|nr:hypothetical protein [Polyangiaceae bacterium]